MGLRRHSLRQAVPGRVVPPPGGHPRGLTYRTPDFRQARPVLVTGPTTSASLDACPLCPRLLVLHDTRRREGRGYVGRHRGLAAGPPLKRHARSLPVTLVPRGVGPHVRTLGL